ncbi:MAG TPA: LpqB family beta-propeller domain-containing protein [Rugosimonospora sp.]|nr:LpqB family beta-propeller domain-containing protein [Rugosimonospora sp.]
MADRREVLRALLLGAAGAAVPAALAGCGVPGGGKPIVDGPGPSAGIGGGSTPRNPPGPGDATRPEDLVKMYLQAVAGSLDDTDRPARVDAAKQFFTPQFANGWAPERLDITVVRMLGQPSRKEGSTATTVDVTLVPVGQLSPQGAVAQPTGSTRLGSVVCSFDVVANPDPRGSGAWRIDGISSGPDRTLAADLLLSSDALDVPLGLFTPVLIYYWSTAHDVLVPDLRYLPLGGSNQKVYTRVVNDLLLGKPADWLDASPTQSGLKLGSATVYPRDNQLQVNLSGSAGIPPQDLMTQLRASLFPTYDKGVQLVLNSQPQQLDGTSENYTSANLADFPARPLTVPPEYCVAGGTVRPVRPEVAPPPVLSNPLNRNVRWAALSRNTRMVAVVRDSGGHQGLWLGSERAGGDYAPVSGLPSTTTNMSRPAWLPGQDRVLVAADGRLFAVDAGDLTAVDITPAQYRVDAFAVGPDGRRIALVSGGVLFVAALLPAKKATTVGGPLQLPTIDLVGGSLSAVAWSRVERVVVAGRLPNSNNTYSLLEITVDGAISQLLDVKTEVITHLTAYPMPPAAGPVGAGKVLGQAGAAGKAYAFEFQGAFTRFGAITPSPSPSASPGKPPAGLTPLAPFYAD